MRCSLTVSLVPEASAGPFVFHGDLDAAVRHAREIGFTGIEIFPPDAHFPEAVDLGRRLTDGGLALAAMGTGAGWLRQQLSLTSGDADVRRRAIDFVRGIVDLAGRHGAPAIVGSMQGRHGNGVSVERAHEWLAEALVVLGAHAKSYGVPLLYEPLNRYETNLFTTLAATGRMLDGLGSANVKILADLFHMNIEEVDPAAALVEAGERVGHVHFVDSNRRAAGMGHTRFSPIATALMAIGYRGWLSAEAFPHPDSVGAAVRTHETFRQFFV